MTLRDRRTIGAALLAVFIGALDLTVIATILPEMVTDLRINAADVDRYVWIVNSYLLAYIVAIPLVGRLSDLTGRTLAFQGSLGLFVIGSAVCALASDLPAMVAGRAIQGAGGGALLPVTMALVGDLYPAGRRAAALGLVGAVDTLGWVLGPIWGAVLVGLAPGAEPWRGVFIVNIPLALLASLAIGQLTRGDQASPQARLPARRRGGASGDAGVAPASARVIGATPASPASPTAAGRPQESMSTGLNQESGKESVSHHVPRQTPPHSTSPPRSTPAPWLSRLDLPGALLLAIALLALNLGLSAGGELGTPAEGGRALGGSRNPLAGFVLPLMLLAGISLVSFVVRQRRIAWPLLPVSLFHSRQFTAAIAANFLIGASLIVAMVDVPVITAIIVEPERVSRDSALMLAPFTVLIAALSLAGGRFAARFGARRTATAGLVLVALGYALLWFGLRGGALTGMLPGLVVAGAGFGLVFAPVSATAIDTAPDAARGIAAAMTLVFRLLGMTTGISILTAIAVRRLQGLVGNLETVVQAPGESTAEFLARQSALLYDVVLPLSLQVARETFLLAGAVALIGIIPAAAFASSRHAPPRSRGADAG